MIREPIGEIPCPLCGRAAELHSSELKVKVAPDSEGRASYPKKMFVICPPIPGYRGCGTFLCNNPHAQQRLLEKGRVFGPDGKPPAAPAKESAGNIILPAPAPKIEPAASPAKAAPPAPGLFGRFR